jgi:hypothetical protein
VLQDYPSRAKVISAGRDALESEFINGISLLQDNQSGTLLNYSQQCFDKAHDFTQEMIPLVEAVPARGKLPPFYKLAWRNYNRQAMMNVQ